ncbi:hypothetical protein, partial [Actinoallomurus spadix]|uniref:hypothetical protein n=1 Tax=Actinoallomurus spadix TaxID=79912 RepID=UPI003CD05B27
MHAGPVEGVPGSAGGSAVVSKEADDAEAGHLVPAVGSGIRGADDVFSVLSGAGAVGVGVGGRWAESQLEDVVAGVAEWAAGMPAELSAGEEQACAVLMRRFATGGVRNGTPRGESDDGAAVGAGRRDRGLFSRLVSASVVDDAVVGSDAVNVRSLGVPAEDWVPVDTWKELFDVLTGGVEPDAVGSVSDGGRGRRAGGGGVVVPAAVFVRVRQAGTTWHMVGLLPVAGDDGTKSVWRFNPDFSSAARQAEIEALERSGIAPEKIPGLIAPGWAGQWLHETSLDDMKHWSPATASALFVDESGHVFKPWSRDAPQESESLYWALTDPTDRRVAGDKKRLLSSAKKNLWEDLKKAGRAGLSANHIYSRTKLPKEKIKKIRNLLASENSGAIRTFKMPGRGVKATHRWALKFDPDNPDVHYTPPDGAYDIEDLNVPPKTVEWLRETLTEAGQAGLPETEIALEAFNARELLDKLADSDRGQFRTWMVVRTAGKPERFYGPTSDANGVPYPAPANVSEEYELLPSGTADERLVRLRYILLIAGRKQSAGMLRHDIHDIFSSFSAKRRDELVAGLGFHWPGQFRTWKISNGNYVGPVYHPYGKETYKLPEGAEDIKVLHGVAPALGGGPVPAHAAGGGLNADELLRDDMEQLRYAIIGVGEHGLRVDEIERLMPRTESGLPPSKLINRLGDFYPDQFRTWQVHEANRYISYYGPASNPRGIPYPPPAEAYLGLFSVLGRSSASGSDDRGYGSGVSGSGWGSHVRVSGRDSNVAFSQYEHGGAGSGSEGFEAGRVLGNLGDFDNLKGVVDVASAALRERVLFERYLADVRERGVDEPVARAAWKQAVDEALSGGQGYGSSNKGYGYDASGYGSYEPDNVAVSGWGPVAGWSGYGGSGSGSGGAEAAGGVASVVAGQYPALEQAATSYHRSGVPGEQFVIYAGREGWDDDIARQVWNLIDAREGSSSGAAGPEYSVWHATFETPSFEDVVGAAGGGEKPVAGDSGAGSGAGLVGVPGRVRWVNALRAYSWGLEFVPGVAGRVGAAGADAGGGTVYAAAVAGSGGSLPVVGDRLVSDPGELRSLLH